MGDVLSKTYCLYFYLTFSLPASFLCVFLLLSLSLSLSLFLSLANVFALNQCARSVLFYVRNDESFWLLSKSFFLHSFRKTISKLKKKIYYFLYTLYIYVWHVTDEGWKNIKTIFYLEIYLWSVQSFYASNDNTPLFSDEWKNTTPP